MKGTSKSIPNNGPLARAARGGAVAEVHRPTENRRAFKPWRTPQPKYEAWFRERMGGQRCQCPDRSCPRDGQQVHHEEFGADKDGRTLIWLSMYCHQTVRHGERGCKGWTPEQYALACRAVAGQNWIEYETAIGGAA